MLIFKMGKLNSFKSVNYRTYIISLLSIIEKLICGAVLK